MSKLHGDWPYIGVICVQHVVLLEKEQLKIDLPIDTMKYMGGIQYDAAEVDVISVPQGRAIPTCNGAFRYDCYYTDHLGNIRLWYSDLNGDGEIKVQSDGNITHCDGTSTSNGEVLQEQHYYPYGLTMGGLNYTSDVLTDLDYGRDKHLYTGKELTEKDLNLYNFGARWYDMSLGRWFGHDPEYEFSSPYLAMGNNPVSFSDPDGRSVTAAVIIGAAVGSYMGGAIANGGDYTPWASGRNGDDSWDFSSGKTLSYMLGGAIVSGVSGYIGGTIAASGKFLSKTVGTMMASYFNSGGTHVYTGGQTDISISMGVASYNFSQNEFGYLGKEDNSTIENIGYGFGALANLQDLVAGFSGTSVNVDAQTSKSDLTGHSAVYNEDKSINISVASGENIFLEKDGLARELEYLMEAFVPRDGRHYTRYTESGLALDLHNVNGKILRNITTNISDHKGLYGLGDLKYGVGFGCINHTARGLLAAGIPTFSAFSPLSHPWMLNSELMIRKLGIFASPYIINNYI